MSPTIVRCLAGLATVAWACLAAGTAQAQTVLWDTSLGGAEIPLGNGQIATRFAAADANGNLFVASTAHPGGTSCFIVTKFNANSGGRAWVKSVCLDSGTTAVSVAVDGAGNPVVTGAIFTGFATGSNRAQTDFRTVKLSGGDGSQIWERTFNGPGPAGASFDVTYDVSLDASGNAFVIGTVFNGTQNALKVIKYAGGDGTILWEASAELAGSYFVAGAGVDAQGNLLVGSQVNVSADPINNASAGPEVIKFSASNGSILWRSRGASVLRMYSFTVDRFGDAVAGYAMDVPGSGGRDMRIVKHSGATGAVLWSRDWSSNVDDIPRSIATDAAGNVAVGAFAANLYTVLRYSRDGNLVWQSTSQSNGSFAGVYSVAYDADGNVYATGAGYDVDIYDRLRATKHAGNSGTELWRLDLAEGSSRKQNRGYAVVPVAGAVYVIGNYYDARNFESGLRIVKVASAAASGSVNVQGLWWAKPAGSESGWGVNLTQQGEKLFATWFTYDSDGQGMWLVMSDGVKAAGNNSWSGALHRTTGPSFNTFSSSNASQVSYQQVGTATFTFTDDNNGSFVYTVNGVSQTKPLTRFIFASPVPTCTVGGSAGSTPNYQDIWWRSPAGSEPGWGVNLAHQGDTLFATWFTYASDSRGLWLVASNVNKVGDRTYSGGLYRTTGPPFSTMPWQPLVNYLPVGSVTFTFNGDGNSGTMDYSVNGITQSKPITRYLFASPPSVCR